jgi:hypothetical protein
MRGVILVAVAAVLGFFVLRLMDDAGVEPTADDVAVADASDDSSDTSAPPEDEGGDEGESSDTTAAPEPRPPAEVTVLVANASGVQGAAGAQTDAIGQGGYQVLPADNAPENLDATQVLHVEGFGPEARVLAEQIGTTAEAVARMPDPPPVELSGANILVLLGTDLASG